MKVKSLHYVTRFGQLMERESAKSEMSCHVIFALAASSETNVMPSDVYFCLIGRYNSEVPLTVLEVARRSAGQRRGGFLLSTRIA